CLLLYTPSLPGSTLFPYTTLFRSCDVNIIPLQVFNRGRDGGLPYGRDFGRWLMKVDTRLTSNDQLSIRYLVDKSTDPGSPASIRSEEHTSELQSRENLVCRLLLEK